MNWTAHTLEEKKEAFGQLLTIMDELREQCPWDQKQTFDSLRKLTIEEMYELMDALLDHNHKDIQEEIGDILLHMVFYAKIGSENGFFDIGDALKGIAEKLISRHPHIYGDAVAKDEQAVLENWEQLKLKEGKKSVLQGVPSSLPALVKAFRLQEKTALVGFEWDTTGQVWEKVEEELQELQEAVHEKHEQSQIEEEFGDVLFSLVNYARFIGVDPEAALEKTNRKFKRRFEYIEANAKQPLTEMDLPALDVLWNEAKASEKR